MNRECEELAVFHVDEAYYFAHYFENEDLFGRLREYYDGEQYRFEVPEAEWDEVEETLWEFYYEPRVIEDVEPYCVVTGKYDEHADILRESVLTWERRGHRFFVMKTELAVDAAIEAGATPIEETAFAVGI